MKDPIIEQLERITKRIRAILHVVLAAIFAITVIAGKTILVVGLLVLIYKLESAFSVWVSERLAHPAPATQVAVPLPSPAATTAPTKQ
jgi:hypothetical protein